MFEQYRYREYRNDIQGLRALGALIIMVFHIWFNKVSGGVDVFFVISGFLMSSILLRDYFSNGIVNPFPFWGSIIKRVAPSAYLVIGVTLVISYFLIPPSNQFVVLTEIIASALHAENILLMIKSVDYLASNDIATPVQQFWALSLQIQFYIVLPFIILPLSYISKKLDSSKPLFIGVLLVIALSFFYAVISVGLKSTTTYFNPLARAWEFFCGVFTFLLAVNLKKISSQNIIGCVGLFLIIGGAILIPRGANFSGAISLIPVMGAILIILSGIRNKKGLAYQILSNRLLVFLGNISFTIYLWHWPLLVFYKEYFDTHSVQLSHGLLIIAISIILAYITSTKIEYPFKNIPKSKVVLNFSVGIIFFLPVIISTMGLRYLMKSSIEDSYRQLESKEIEPYSKSAIFYNKKLPEFDRRYLLSISKMASYQIGCGQTIKGTEVKTCSFGDSNSTKEIVLVGSSHADQWLPALDRIGKSNNLKITSITKGACSFADLNESNPSCMQWNKKVVSKIEDLKPYALITNSTITSYSKSERVPKYLVSIGSFFNRKNIKVIGIRDNPRFPYSVPECVYRKRKSTDLDLPVCSIPRDAVLLPSNPAERYSSIIHNIDLSNMLCTNNTCLAYFDDKLIYRDSNHLNLEYTYFIQNEFERQLLEIIDKK